MIRSFNRACACVIVLGLISACSLIPGQKMYWDGRVKEMCDKDGGVKVYERVRISKTEARLLWGQGLPLPAETTRLDANYFWERTYTTIHDSNLSVVRAEERVTRRADRKLLGMSVRYGRRGGDFPTGLSETTRYICPESGSLIDEVFMVDDAPK